MTNERSVTVFGHDLTREFSEITVSDEVFAKLKGNATIDVMVRKADVDGPQAAPVVAAQPEPSPEPQTAEAPEPASPAAAPAEPPPKARKPRAKAAKPRAAKAKQG